MFQHVVVIDVVVTIHVGVEHATASFKDGLVCVWIHPGKINREKLTEALTKRGVTLAEKKGEKGEK